jgi:hypothetical protein
MKKKPDISVSVGGYDCTGDGKWTPEDFYAVAAAFVDAGRALEKKTHGAIDEPGLVNIGLDFGGPFDEKNGLPQLPRNSGDAKPGASDIKCEFCPKLASFIIKKHAVCFACREKAA